MAALPEEPERTLAGTDATLSQAPLSREDSRALSNLQGAEQNPSAPRLDGYVLTELIGRGAFAEVWKAWQTRTRKWVAAKVFLQRRGVNWVFLQREIERLIRLDKHPHIVTLLDADLHGEPPFYAMELMEGGSLERFVRDPKGASADKAAQWMAEMADALAYVHSKGLIHCDLKPANVLLDEMGHVRIADFGQSRIVTESAGALGTLYYMAPEQAVTEAEGTELHPDVRWDVYGLGTTVAAVATGRVPRLAAMAGLDFSRPLAELLAAYRRAVEAAPVPDCRSLTAGKVDEDLSAVLGRCLEAVPQRRYGSMVEVESDLKARAERRPVSVLADLRGYRLKRFVQRNALAVALAGVALACAVGAVAHWLRAYAQVRQELAYTYLWRGLHASEQGDEPGAAAYFAKSFAVAPFESDLIRANALSSLAHIHRPRRVLVHSSPVRRVAFSPDGSRLITADETGLRFWDSLSGRQIGELGGTLTSLAVSSGGVLACNGFDKCFLLDPSSYETLQKLDGWHGVLSPDGRSAFTLSVRGRDIRALKIAPGAEPRIIARLPGKEGWSSSLAISPDGKTLASCWSETLRFWDIASGRQVGPAIPTYFKSLLIPALDSVRFGPDGRAVLSLTMSRAQLYSAPGGKALGTPMSHDGFLTSAAISPDGLYVATGGEDRRVRLWIGPAAPGRFKLQGAPGQPWVAYSHAAAVNAVAFSPDSKVVLSCGGDGAAMLFDLRGQRIVGPTLFHGSVVNAVAFSPDGQRVLTGSRDGTARLWDRPQEPTEGLIPVNYPRQILLHPAGGRLLTVRSEKILRLYDLRSRQPISEEFQHQTRNPCFSLEAAFSPDGRQVMTWCREDSTVRLWDAATGRAAGNLTHPNEVWSAAFSPDSRWVLTGGRDGVARLWDARTGQTLGKPWPQANAVDAVAFSPDGRQAATHSVDGPLRFWLLPGGAVSGKDISLGRDQNESTPRLLFSPDGRRLATVGLGGKAARLWDVSRRAELSAGPRHEAQIRAAAFSPDSRRLATASDDGTARLWDARNGRPASAPLHHPDEVWSAAFSPDGKWLATGCKDGAIRLWETATGYPVGRPLLIGKGIVSSLAFSSDGRWLFSDGAFGEARRWDLGWLQDQVSRRRLSLLSEAVAQRRVSEQGEVEVIPTAEWTRLVDRARAAGLLADPKPR